MKQTFFEEIKTLTKKSREQLVQEYFDESVLNHIVKTIKDAAKQGEYYTKVTLRKAPYVLGDCIEEVLKTYFPGFNFPYIQESSGLNGWDFLVFIEWNNEKEEE